MVKKIPLTQMPKMKRILAIPALLAIFITTILLAGLHTTTNNINKIESYTYTRISEMQETMIDDSISALWDAKEAAIRSQARRQALELSSYLADNPRTLQQLIADPQVKALSATPIGAHGHTGLFDLQTFKTHLHYDYELQGLDLRIAAEEKTDFGLCLEQLERTEQAETYINWDAAEKGYEWLLILSRVKAPTTDGYQLAIKTMALLEDTFTPVKALNQKLESSSQETQKNLSNKFRRTIRHTFTSAVSVIAFVVLFAFITSMFGLKLYQQALAENKQRRIAEKEIKRSHERLKSLYRISRLDASTVEELLDGTLQEALRLTGSTSGCIYTYDEEKSQLHLKAHIVDSKSLPVEDEKPVPKSADYVWKRVLIHDMPVVKNTAPTDDPPLPEVPTAISQSRNYLAQPIRLHNRIVAAVGVSNKECEYKRNDIEQLRSFFNSTWPIIEALEASKANQLLHKQLTHADKLASIGTLASGVAHEVNNPLTIVSFNSEIIRNELSKSTDPKVITKSLDNQKRAINRIKAIVDGLRNYARADTQTMHEVDLNHAITETTSLIESIYKKDDIHIELSLAPTPCPFIGNEGKMQQVLMNLLSNSKAAIKKQDVEGRIVIETKIENDQIVFHYSDNGCGISKENLKKIFDPFFTTKKEGEGTGIGLALSLGIIDSFGGTMEARSELRLGTEFTITLPVAQIQKKSA
jgi:C4-dicarboxylate-specific signal transduction histidine kinase